MLQASAICLHVILSSLYSLTTKSFDVSLMGGLPVGFLFRLTFSISSTPFVHRNPIITDLLPKVNPFWQIFFHKVNPFWQIFFHDMNPFWQIFFHDMKIVQNPLIYQYFSAKKVFLPALSCPLLARSLSSHVTLWGVVV